MRWSRIGLYTLAGIVTTLLLAVVILVSVDLGLFKERIEVLVTDMLDREFSIDGELHISVGPSIELSAEDVYLANPEWANEETFVTASKIDIAVDAWSLVNGPVEIERVEIDGVIINIENNGDGNASWIFKGLETRPDSDIPENAATGRLPVIVHNTAIHDIQVSYNAPALEKPLLFITDSLLSSIDADIFRVELTGSLNGTPLHFAKATSPIENLLEYGDVTVEWEGNIGEITIAGSAEIDDLLAPRRPRVELEIKGPSANYLAEILSVPPVTTGALGLSVSILENGEEMIASLSGVFGEFDFAVSGRFQDLQELHEIELDIAANGPDIGTLIRMSGGDYTDSDPFDIQGRIIRSGSEVTIENVQVAIGASEMTIDGFLGEFPTLKGGNLSLQAAGPDYGRFNRLFGLPGRLGGPFTTSLNITPNEDGRARVELAANTADIQARMDSLVSSADNFLGTTVQLEITGPDIRTVASAAGVNGLRKEAFRITATAEKDPDGYLIRSFDVVVDDDELKIAGHIGDMPFSGNTDLQIEFSGSNIGESVVTLGVPAENLPKGAFYLTGGVQKRDGQLWLRDVVAAIGNEEEYQFRLSGFVNPDADFVGSQVQVQAYGGSIAALAELAGLQGTPDVPFDIDVDLHRGQSNTYFEKGIFKSGVVVVEFSGEIGDELLADDMELTFNASVPGIKDVVARLGLDAAMLPDGDLVASGTVRQVAGRISVEPFAATLGGATLQINGDIGQPPALNGTRFRFELVGDDLSRLLPPDASGGSLAHAFAASGRVAVSGNEMELERFRANVGHTTVAGDFKINLDPLFESGTFGVQADSPDLFQLLPELQDVSVPQIGKMKFRGSGSWADNFWRFEKVRLELGDGFIEISGSLDGPPTFERTDLELEWVALSASKLSVLAGRELPDHPLRLKAHLVGTRDLMTMEDFEFTFGESDLGGQFTMRAGEVPAVGINVTSRLFDISEYLPVPEEEPQAAIDVVDNEVIPDTPIPLQLLQSFAADVDIEIDELRTRSLRLFGLELDASVSDGALKVENFAFANQGGGSFSLSTDLTPNSAGGADFVLAAEGKDMMLAVRAKTDDDLKQIPRLQFRADLTANGATVRELAGSLDGYIRVVGGEGRIPNGSFGFLTQDFVSELISTINPFARSDPYTSVECAVVLLHFDDGVMDADPVFVQQTDKLRVFASANIDLQTEKLDANFKIVPRKGLGISLSNLVNPYIKVTGTLAKPALVIDPEGVLIEGSLAVATAGLSVIAKSLKNRFLSGKDPCGKALADADERFADRKSTE